MKYWHENSEQAKRIIWSYIKKHYKNRKALETHYLCSMTYNGSFISNLNPKEKSKITNFSYVMAYIGLGVRYIDYECLNKNSAYSDFIMMYNELCKLIPVNERGSWFYGCTGSNLDIKSNDIKAILMLCADEAYQYFME